jgi:hypothetical protein
MIRFAPGEVLLRRSWRGGRITFMQLTRVVADDEHGLRLWVAAGYPYWRIMNENGETHHDAPVDRLGPARLTRLRWTGSDVMMWMPDGEPYSVWWFWQDGMFAGWYANLEEVGHRWSDHNCAGYDTADQALDVRVSPDRLWEWKDEDEFKARTGHPMYWSAEQGTRIRATGERLIGQVERGAFPFDGTWCGYRPDAGWTVPALPVGAERPRELS